MKRIPFFFAVVFLSSSCAKVKQLLGLEEENDQATDTYVFQPSSPHNILDPLGTTLHLTASPESVTAETTATFEFDCDFICEFLYRLDDGTWQQGSSPLSIDVALGLHTIEFKASEQSEVFATHDWRVSTIPTSLVNLQLNSPENNAIASDRTPKFIAFGLDSGFNGNTLRIYTDADCSTEVGDALIEDNRVEVNNINLGSNFGTVSFYGRTFNEYGLGAACQDLQRSYTLQKFPLGGHANFYQQIKGIRYDGSEFLYLADRINDKIHKIRLDGTEVLSFGDFGSGVGQFWSIEDVDIDSSGNIYVANGGSSKLQKFDSTGSFITEETGVSGISAIEITDTDMIYAVETLSRIVRVYDTSLTEQSNFGSFGFGDGQFVQPSDIVVDTASSSIYVSDLVRSDVQRFNLSAVYQNKFISLSPYRIDLGPENRLFAVDTYNFEIRSTDTTGGSLETISFPAADWMYPYEVEILPDGTYFAFVGYELVRFSANHEVLYTIGSSAVEAGRMTLPKDVSIGPLGRIYVAEELGHRVQVFDANGQPLFVFGQNGTGDGEFNQPCGIAVNSQSEIYVVDPFNDRVSKFSSNGTFVEHLGTSGSADGQFDRPSGIYIDSSDNIYISERSNDRVQKFNSAGSHLLTFGASGTGNGQFQGAEAIFVDGSGNIYVADSNRDDIQKFNSSGVYQSTIGSPGSGNGQFDNIEGVVVDSAGNIFATDVHDRIQKFNAAGTYLATYGSNGDAIGEFRGPQKMFIDSSDNIYIADGRNGRIQKMTNMGVMLTE